MMVRRITKGRERPSTKQTENIKLKKGRKRPVGVVHGRILSPAVNGWAKETLQRNPLSEISG